MHLDVTTLALLWIGGSLLLLPLLLITLRAGVLPLLAAVERLREQRGWRNAGLERRLARNEEQLARLTAEVERLRRSTMASTASPHA